MRSFRFLLALLAGAALLSAAPGPSETGPSGTYRGRVLTERFLHQQAQSRRIAALSAEQAAPIRLDQGNIAIIDTSNGVVPTAEFFRPRRPDHPLYARRGRLHFSARAARSR